MVHTHPTVQGVQHRKRPTIVPRYAKLLCREGCGAKAHARAHAYAHGGHAHQKALVDVVSMLSAPASGSATCTAVTAVTRDHQHSKASSCTFRAAV